ncbi:hypothetical protein ABGB17_13315 [Sphaerisporangium sp. B11E5]|uniref:hypothetical protein n=1 Tax=Sphaerisporangium sp. B11E5 TaxID=3153563 RepID=UPI00325E5C28
MAERWCDGRAIARALVSAAAVLLLLHGVGAHSPAPLGPAWLPHGQAAPAVLPMVPVDGPVPASDQDGCPKQGEQTGESGWVKPPPPPCRDCGRRARRRDALGEAALAARAARARRGRRSKVRAGRGTRPLLPVFRC